MSESRIDGFVKNTNLLISQKHQFIIELIYHGRQADQGHAQRLVV